MPRRTDRAAYLLLLAILVASSAAPLSGCATTGTNPPPAAEVAAVGGAKAKVPMEIAIHGLPREGDVWKSRFVSTSEMKRTYKGPDGKEAVKVRTVGLELVAEQKVVSVASGRARVEVRELSSRILQEGRFIEAPFRRLNPPASVFFTVDLAAATTDFTEMEKAYDAWMKSVREGPAGDIFGKTFRVDDYVGQLKELYGRPFTRFLGKRLSKEPRPGPAGEMVHPFLGPGVALGPVPVETTAWYEGFEAKGGMHQIRVAGKYAGNVAWTPEELANRLEDFGAPPPAGFKPSGEAQGHFTSVVDILSGREIRSESQLGYSASASFEGGSLAEEISGKSILEPAD